MSSTRDRMVTSAALLVREQGARATSIDDVLAHSGAPRGSVYHHFPGGRAELLREATDYAGAYVAGLIEGTDGVLELLDELLRTYRDQLVQTDFRAGCPVVAVAVESDDDLQPRAASAFNTWTELIGRRLVEAGVDADRAGELAVVVISSVEGALVMARARRDAEPLDIVHRQLRTLLLAETNEGSTG